MSDDDDLVKVEEDEDPESLAGDEMEDDDGVPSTQPSSTPQ